MEQYQSNRVKMYGASSNYLHGYPETVNSIPSFAEALVEFDENLSLIKEQEVFRNTTSEGKTEVKHNLENQMILEAINVSSSVRAYAAKNKLTELKSIIKVSVRKLVRLKEVDLVTKCTQIYNEAKKLEDKLGSYGLTAEKIELLKTKIDEYKASGAKRDSSVAERKGIKINIIDLLNEQDELLEDRLDPFVNKFMQSDKMFYDGYYASRQIKEYGVRHNKKEDETVDATESSVTAQPGK